MATYKNVTLTPPAGGGTLTFEGTDASERILFADPHHVGFGDAKLDLGGGDDLIPDSSVAYFNHATVSGGAGDDNVTLNGTVLQADGGAGNDTVALFADFDAEARGGAGNDHLSAVNTDTGEAAAYGGAGNDVIYVNGDGEGGEGDAYGGAGNDRINLDGANISADGGSGDDRMTSGLSEIAVAHGGAGNDTLTFSGTDLQLFGDAGNDTITGQVYSTDEQYLYGGTGDDTIRYTLGDKADAGATVDLYGGAGKDQLYAGAAHDVLHFLPADTPAGAGRDVVHGYQHGQDHVALDGDADLSKAGTQHYSFVGETKSPGAGQVGFYHQGHDTILDGFDGKTHFEVQLQGFHGHLDASDFIA
jgi:Ca2+-binding RTX toxin-like protein